MSTSHRHRHHTSKRDPITAPDSSPEETAVHMTLGPFDRAIRDMDRKWGIDRLHEMVCPETAQKWGYAMGKLNESIEARQPVEVAQWVGVCLRGLAAMDNEAETNGAPKADPEIWEYDLDGFKFAIIRDDREWPALKAARPDLLFFTMREVAVAMKAYKFDGVVTEIKKHFPGAQVSEIRKPQLPKSFFDNGGDDLNF